MKKKQILTTVAAAIAAMRDALQKRSSVNLKIQRRLNPVFRQDLQKIPMKEFSFCEVAGCKFAAVLSNKLPNLHFLKILSKFKQHLFTIVT